jgi:hypothetical protein
VELKGPDAKRLARFFFEFQDKRFLRNAQANWIFSPAGYTQTQEPNWQSWWRIP